jgi:hypothetical protein
MNRSRTYEIDSLEARSFARYCAKVGRTVSEVEAELMPEVRRVFEQRFIVAEQQFGADEGNCLRAKYTPALSRGYLAANRATIETEREGYVDELVDAAPLLPSDYSSLGPFANSLDCELPSPRDVASLRLFLELVPTVNLFDHEFNAFVSGNTITGGVPAVCVFPHLHGSLSILIDCVLPVIVEKDANFRPLETTVALARRPLFKSACMECLEIICSERFKLSDDVWDLERLAQWPGGISALDVTTLGGWSFVWFHEYAHLLRGHLFRDGGPELEHEADEFAQMMLVRFAKKLGVATATWMLTGAIFVIVAILVMERLHGLGTTHPPTMERLQRFIAGRSWPQKIADRVTAACEIATRDRWGFDLKMR